MEISPSPSPGKEPELYILGIGPGSPEMLTRRAGEILGAADIIIGNDFYLDQIASIIAGKRVIRSRMGKEVERAQEAVRLTGEGTVVMVSGGDPGIYGMASIVLEVVVHSGSPVKVQVIPGITAASMGASLLGSPLSSDFAVVSLSDLLTPWEVIVTRLNALFSIGIPVVLYNPKSRTRTCQFDEALAIAEQYLPGTTPVGIVKNADRPGEEILITTLGNAPDHEDFVDMHSVVFIGGSETRIFERSNHEKCIITPRGYHRKYVY